MGVNKKSLVADSLGLGTNTVARSYMMTVWFDKNGQTFEEKKDLMQKLFDDGLIRYAALSKELCPDTGRLHGHLFTRFVDAWSGVKAFQAYNIESGGGWFEAARKDYPSYEYVSCSGHFAEGQGSGKSKPLDFFEIGERPKSGSVSKKNDFSACLAMIESGYDLLEVCRAYPELAIKGFSNLQRLYFLVRENKSKERLSAQYDENVEKAKLLEKEEELLHGLKGKTYFVNPHFEPGKLSLEGVIDMFAGEKKI